MSEPKEKDSPASKPVSQEETKVKKRRSVKVYDASVVAGTFARIQHGLIEKIDRQLHYADTGESISDMARALSHVTSQLRTIQRERDRKDAE